MANSIGWGEIYKYTWWGNFSFNTQSIPKDSAPNGFFVVAEFKIRVLADGGTFEGETCLIEEYNKLI